MQPPPIENNRTVANHTDNHHGVDGYLDDQVVAAAVADQSGGEIGEEAGLERGGDEVRVVR